MSSYEATFEVDSKTDAYAVRKILERTYDTVREESRSVRDGSEDSDALLRAFEELKTASKEPTPGTLTITYEKQEDGFDD